MKSQFRYRLLTAASVLLIVTTPGRADIVTMKNGEKHEGKILSETPDSIEMEYKLTAKIKDRKTFMKGDIAEIKKQTAAEVEFAERALAKLLPTPDLLTAADYESMIQDKLRTFAAKYPGAPETAEAEKIIKALADEKTKVLSGQLKVNGNWLDAATVKRDDYDIQGYRLRSQMKQKAAENTDTRYLDALRIFEKLRTDYGASTHFVLAIPEALDILKKFDVQLSGMLTEAPVLLKQRQDGLKALTPGEGADTRRSIEAEERAYKAVQDAQNKSRVKWRDLYKYDIKGIQAEQATVAKERSELQAIDSKALQTENNSLLAMIRYMGDGNLTEAEEIYSKVGRDPNLINKTLVPSLGKKLADLKQAAKKVKTSSTTAAATPSSTDASPGGPNQAAEIYEKIKQEQAKKAAQKGAGAPGASTTGATAATGDKKAPGAAAKPATAPTPPPAPPEPTLMETITDYVPYIGGGLLAVLVAAMVISKKKKKDE